MEPFQHNSAPHADLPPRPKPFTLWKINLILLPVFIGILVSLFVTGKVSDSAGPREFYVYGYAAGSFLGTLLISLLLGWIAYRLGRRSNSVGNVVFLIVFLLFGVDKLAGLVQRYGGMPKSMLEFQESVKELNQQRLKEYEEGYTTGTMEHMDKVTQLADGMARKGGMEGVVGETMKAMISTIKEEAIPLENAMNEMASNELDLEQIKAPEDFDPHIARAKAMREETEKYVIFYGKLPETTRNLAEKNGMPAKDAAEFARGASKTLRVEEHRKYRQTIIDFCQSMEDYCAYLKENWGKWEYNKDLEEPVFKPDTPSEMRTRFAEITEHLGVTLLAMLETEETFMKQQFNQ